MKKGCRGRCWWSCLAPSVLSGVHSHWTNWNPLSESRKKIQSKSSEDYVLCHHLSTNLSKQLVVSLHIDQRKIIGADLTLFFPHPTSKPTPHINLVPSSLSFLVILSNFGLFVGWWFFSRAAVCFPSCFIFLNAMWRLNNKLNWQENHITQSVQKDVKYVRGRTWRNSFLKIRFAPWEKCITLAAPLSNEAVCGSTQLSVIIRFTMQWYLVYLFFSLERN